MKKIATPATCRRNAPLAPFGALAIVFALFTSPAGSRADIVYSLAGGNTIHRFTSNGTESVFYTLPFFISYGGIAFDSAGDLYVADSQNNKIEKLTLGGALSVFADASSGLNQPSGLAFDMTGNLFVTGGGTIRKFTPSGVGSTFATAFYGPSGLAFDSAGSLFSAYPINERIMKFTPGGISSTFTDTSSGLTNPKGLAFDSAGNMFLANADSIWKFTPDGARTLFATNPVDSPVGLAFGSTGDLYATVAGGWVDKYTPDGVRSVFFGDHTLGSSSPSGLAITDDAGRPLLSPGTIPEPGSVALLGTAATLLAARRRRQRFHKIRE